MGSKPDLFIMNVYDDNNDLKGFGGGLNELIFVCNWSFQISLGLKCDNPLGN